MVVKIYPSWNWGNDLLVKTLFKLSQNGMGLWNSIQIVSQKEEADYFLVVNYTEEVLNLQKTILFQGEPIGARETWPAPWNHPQKEDFFYLFDTEHHHNFIEWHHTLTYQELISTHPEKSKRFSTVTSNYKSRWGHRWRFVFCIFLKFFFKDFDWFGKGVRPLDKKEEGIFPYKYTFAAENSQEKNYFTEKIIDGVLGECLTFYWGCPNIEDFIDPVCYMKLNIKRPLSSLLKIRKAMKNNVWEKRIELIRKEKVRVMNELNTLALVDKIISEKLL